MRTPFAVLLLASLAAACSSPATSTGGGASDGFSIGFDGSTTSADAKGPADTKSSDASSLGDTASGADAGTVSDAPSGETGGGCVEDEFQCFNAKIVKHCVNGAWVADPCNDDEACQDGTCVKLASCTPGAKKCDGYQYALECAADGKAWVPTKCKPPQLCVAGACVQTVCVPNVSECVAGTTGDVHTCLPDGSGWGPTTTCKNSTCLGGKCLSLCESNLKVANNVGCEYWSVDLDSFKDTFSAALHPKGLTPDMIPHSVVIANPGEFDAKITFTIASSCPDSSACVPDSACKNAKACDKPGAVYELNFADTTVKKGQTREFKMPVMNAEGNTLAQKGVHIKSDQPILAWQFNPFNSENAASNDGTLLLPQHMLGQKYYVVSGGISGVPAMGFPAQHGYFTVVAASPGLTKVTITPSGDVDGDATYGIPPLKKGVPWTTTLLQHGALTLQAKAAQLSFSPKTVDLTGSLVVADKPVAVFGGHEELVLGYLDNTGSESGFDSCCAEHVEEQLLPVDNWGTDVMCVKTKPRGSEPDFWRVVAGEDNVKITTIPPITSADSKYPSLNGYTFAKAGDWIEVPATQSFMLHASGKVEVVQYLVSAGQTDENIGDPSMQLVPSMQHYRSDYQILTAQGYKDNLATVVRPAGLAVSMDGAPMQASQFSSFGDGTWEYAYVSFKSGPHSFEAKQPFGLQVYGYGNKTAYSYTGGMMLK